MVGREFNPTTWEEFVQLVSGDKNAWFRMVRGYWEMAAPLVTSGAIDPVMFRASNGEMIAVFAKVEPFLAQMRGPQAEFLQHMEQVVRESGRVPGDGQSRGRGGDDARERLLTERARPPAATCHA